jgi:eukaryotic-like serine/threonine-protein kinase
MSTTIDQRTLASRMNEERIPVSEALHYAMSLADALRKLHDAGKAHGALTPSSIVLNGSGVDLVPSPGPLEAVTPYTAPEVLQGQPADARSDIFSFGALVFEMLTGHRAFDGETQTELKLALSDSAPPPSGSPAVDRLVTNCVAKAPAARWQRMQKIIMELKLLTVAARRADKPAVSRPPIETVLRAEMQQVEARLSARLSAYEQNMVDAKKIADDAVTSVKEELTVIHTQLVALQERPMPQNIDVDALMKQIQGHVQQSIEAATKELHAHLLQVVETTAQKHGAEVQAIIAASSKQTGEKVNETVAAANQRVAAAEQNMEEIRKHFATLQANVAGDLHDVEKTLKSQAVAIESSRTAMAQTDDLVERVVEALELMQSSMIDQHEAAEVN